MTIQQPWATLYPIQTSPFSSPSQHIEMARPSFHILDMPCFERLVGSSLLAFFSKSSPRPTGVSTRFNVLCHKAPWKSLPLLESDSCYYALPISLETGYCYHASAPWLFSTLPAHVSGAVLAERTAPNAFIAIHMPFNCSDCKYQCMKICVMR